MQLPRGRFHRLLKSTTSRVLIEEMGSTRFTGICTIVLGNESVILVLNEGLVVLAEYGGMKGRHALDAALEDGGSEAAAELNILTTEQVQLALEFNKLFATAETGKEKRSSPARAASGGTKPSAGPRGAGAAFVPKRRPEPPAERQGIPMPGVKPAQAPEPGNDEIDTLVQNMESMDVDQLVNDFRVNCKDILRRIHLDHLIQDQDT
ncbi:hypothetical protein F8E02_09720 [Methanoculleus sp. Wushi-C6]|uniref:Uncharacterized protein n=1 Tax=Methanoculleus caldifontis TaxID=2651577 RepID=A0ABU3X3C2_9EURY|nr:hypothetical protein [Methanoculleus sp. Wushi-C6]MDV2482270.1 hypothetical protein [Methanoculleus sp. Wushi-C6]